MGRIYLCGGIQMVHLNPEIFREYDIRGVVGEDLSEKSVRTIAKAYGTLLRNHGIHSAILGRDVRLSSYAYSRAFADGLMSCGINVIDIGMVTTPVFYFARILYNVEGGAMVTASHNPPEFNGFKLALGKDTLYGEGIQEIRKIAEKGEFAAGYGTLSERDPIPEYIEDLASRITLGPRKVLAVIDAGNGAAGPIARRVLERLGANFVEMYFEPDGTFPNHHPDPIKPKNLKALAMEVALRGADLGIAFDGDADRIGVVDRNGRPVWGDELQVLFWKEILAKHPGALALIEVKCSQALIEMVEKLGGKPEFTRTGHSLIKAKMRETNALFSAEVSGHMFFRDEHYGYDDALYAALRLLRILTNTDKPLDELLQEVPKYYATPEIRVYCPDDQKFRVVQELKERFAKDYRIVTVDGVRVLFSDGWGLIRASNTQPALVLRAESRTPEGLENIKKTIEEYLGGYSSVGKIEWE